MDLCVAGTARADRNTDLDIEDGSNPDRKLLQLQPDGQGLEVDNAGGAMDVPETGRALLGGRCSLTLESSLVFATCRLSGAWVA